MLDIEDSMLRDSIIGNWSFSHSWQCYSSDTLYNNGEWNKDTCYFIRDYFGGDQDSLVHEWFVNSQERKLLLYFSDTELFGFPSGYYFTPKIEFLDQDSICLKESYFDSFFEAGEDVFTECDRMITLIRL